MNEYPKIQTVLKRDPETKFRTLLEGEFSEPEFEYLQDAEWVFTEKIDGTNIRVLPDSLRWPDGGVIYGGRTNNAQIPIVLLDQLNTLFRSDRRCEEIFPEGTFCLYGEGYGAKIQKGGNYYIPDGVDFILFDVKVGDFWLKRDDVEDVAKRLGIRVVPVVGTGTLLKAVEMARRGIVSELADTPAEGLVMRPAVELQTRRGERLITKIKSKDFAA